MSEDELKQYYGLYTELWRFFRKHCNEDDSEEAWAAVKEDHKVIYEKYHTEFAKRELVNILQEKERLCKMKKASLVVGK